MWLIVGLGNPGPRYIFTRHNIGFLTIDSFLRSINASQFKTEMKAEIVKVKLDDESIIFAKPLTFMNLSGESVAALMNYYHIDIDHLLVIHDDLDLEFGTLRLQKNRGSGGHNGIKSITEKLGTQDYSRLKMGIGKPPHPQMDSADYVLESFSKTEQNWIPDFINAGTDAIESFIFEGFKTTENKFNGFRLIPNEK